MPDDPAESVIEIQSSRPPPGGAAGRGSQRYAVFGPFRLDLGTGELYRGEEKLPLRPQSFVVLRALLEKRGEIVSRDELISLIWPAGEVFVEQDLGLNAIVRRLRDVLEDNARDPGYVETLPRRGYRFIAPVEPCSDPVEYREPSSRSSDRGLRFAARWIALTTVAIASVVVVAVLGWRRESMSDAGVSPLGPSAPAPTAGRGLASTSDLVVAVEPFQVAGDLSGRSYLASTLVQEIVVALGSVSTPERRVWTQWLEERPEAYSTMSPDDRPDFLVSGSYSLADQQARVVTTLRRSDNGVVLWGETFESEEGDLFRFQQPLARRIASVVAATVLGLEPEAAALEVVADSEAYDEYLKGLYAGDSEDAASLAAAADHFERSMRLDPGFARAHAAAATVHLALAYRGNRDEHWQAVRRFAEQALALDENLAEAHLAKAMRLLYHEWDFAGADRSLRRALALAPGSGKVQSASAAFLAVVGDFDQALARARLARRHDPAKLSVRGDLCWYLNHAARFREAEEECRRALELEASDGNSRLGLAEALRNLGDLPNAVVNAATAFGVSGRFPLPKNDAQALELHTRLFDRAFAAVAAQEAPTDHYQAAVFGALSGRLEEAFVLLERAADERSPGFLYFRTDPRLGDLRNDPRFDRLARRVGFPVL